MDGKLENAKRNKFLIALIILTAVLVNLPVARTVAKDDWQYPHPYSRGYYERLEYYESKYSNEMLRFCESRYLRNIRKLGRCLRRQQEIKDSIFANMQRQLDSHSRAQAMYQDCLDYHPRQGVERIGVCIETRLMLYDRVSDESIERLIYQICELKWRRNTTSAIDVCCAHEGRYYRDNGKLRD